MKNQEENKEILVDDGAIESGPVQKNKAFIIIAITAIIMIIGGFIYYKSSSTDEMPQQESQAAYEENIEQIIFHELDEMIINLDTKGKIPSFLKIKVTLEVYDQASLAVIQKMMPKINDALLVHLRTLRASDLHGSIALYRLREELLTRINKIVYPAKITDVLFKDMLVQ